ncbi:uncharacterized protein CBL_00927 [Carabus blaptoides fortunei]
MDYYFLLNLTILLIGLCSYFVQCLEYRDIVFLVLSQRNKYNYQLALDLKQNIINQATTSKQDVPRVHFSHEEFSNVGDWIVLPLVPKLFAKHRNTSTWLVVCTENTRFNLPQLINTLSKYNPNKEIWLGHALFDHEATIIHHFAFHDAPESFLYPNMASGFAISVPLLKKLSHRVKKLRDTDLEFSIDASHEFAIFVWNKGRGPVLTHEVSFCVEEEPHCAAYVEPFVPCNKYVPNESIYFAVKTCSKFHKDRVRVVQNTWGKYVKNIAFFSDVEDKNIPTIDLAVPNTEYGHCGKTTAILKYLSNEISLKAGIKWVIIADDDTILGVSRLQQILSCYDSSDNITLGERYGYQAHTNQGYNYITGGGGMVFSATLVRTLATRGVCTCPSNNTPDDMYIGVCLARIRINVVHCPMFHQARPTDYASAYLASHAPVSFHKHWMLNPAAVYEKWFAEEDERASNIVYQKTEL